MVEQVAEIIRVAGKEVPHRAGLFRNSMVLSLLQRIAEEGTEQRGVGVLSQLKQVADVELKIAGKLEQELVHTVKELKKCSNALKYWSRGRKKDHFEAIFLHLPNELAYLKEDGTPFVGIRVAERESTPIRHLMSEIKPFFFNENSESFQGSVIRINEKLR